MVREVINGDAERSRVNEREAVEPLHGNMQILMSDHAIKLVIHFPKDQSSSCACV
jgi:hypothetical protein